MEMACILPRIPPWRTGLLLHARHHHIELWLPAMSSCHKIRAKTIRFVTSPTGNLRFLMELTDSDGGPSRGAGFRNHYSEIHRHVH